MVRKIDTVKLEQDNKRLQNEYENFLNMEKKVRPVFESIKIALLYLSIGALWILLSDKILNAVIKSENLVRRIQMYKGWLYVIITATIFYFIIRKTLQLYKDANDSVLRGYEELSTAHEELMAMNEELEEQNLKLEVQHNELSVIQERYQLAVEGANDGIWDWDILNDVYFVTDKWKQLLGYEPHEVGDTIYAWEGLIYPQDWEQTKNAVNQYIEEKRDFYESIYRVRHKSGEYHWILSRGKGVRDKNGKATRIAGSHTDITERVQLEEKLQLLAYYDNLTGLPNRILFEEEVTKAIQKYEKIAIINVDMDDLKHVNDMFGNKIGDCYIQHIAKILANLNSFHDMAVRLNGDQFAILLTGIDTQQDISDILELLIHKIRKPWNYNGQDIYGTVSMGVTVYPEHGTDVGTLIQNAEIAMFQQKQNGKNGYIFFQPAMYEKTLYYIQMNRQLREAIEKEEFVLYYQPQYDLRTGDMIAMEALIRWNHPQKGFISPMEFVPVAEKTGQITPISKWVLRTAIKQRREWEDRGYQPVKIAVNLSGQCITENDTIDSICRMFKEVHIQPGEIEIEVTETSVMIDMHKAQDNLQKLRNFGITVAMDDFGTGYSSLTYLHELPLDILKIDREFIKNVKTKDEDASIYKTVVEMAHSMKLHVVAEGIETKEQNEFLLKNNCDIGQGFYFSRPLPASEIEKIMIQV